MTFKCRPFYRFSILIYMLSMLYILICGFAHLKTYSDLPYLHQAMLIIVFAALLICIWLFASIIVKIESYAIYKKQLLLNILEGAVVISVIAVSAVMRYQVISALPMEPQSDFRTFYEIAQLYNKGALITEGPGYCDYVAMFPHIMGYSMTLAFVFKIFGTSVFTAQIFGLILSLASCLAAYRTARLIAGRIAGLTALIIYSFLPSTILFTNFLASEYLFTFLSLICIWLFTWLSLRLNGKIRHPWLFLLLYAVLGILLAYASAVRPLSVILMAAIFLCILPERINLPVRPRNDQPVALRAVSKGWVRCIVIFMAYMLTSTILNTRVEFAIDRKPAGISASAGYNLMVGLNAESKGTWNEADSQYLYDALAESSSAAGAQLVCRGKAIERLNAPAAELLNLFAEKFSSLWSNDDFGVTWNLLFLEQQNQLNTQREAFLNMILPFGSIMYLSIVFLCGLGGIMLWHKSSKPAYVLVLFFLGTAALHIFAEVQNRYHFHILPVFAILSGCAAAGIISERRRCNSMSKELRKAKSIREHTNEELVREMERVQAELNEKRENALKGVFDIRSAIKEGHVRVIVSQAYAKKEEPDESTE